MSGLGHLGRPSQAAVRGEARRGRVHQGGDVLAGAAEAVRAQGDHERGTTNK